MSGQDWLAVVKTLEAERDRLAMAVEARDAMIDRLKAELDKSLGQNRVICNQGLLWKSKAEKLAEALSKIAHFDGGMPGKVREYAEEALAQYEKGNESL